MYNREQKQRILKARAKFIAMVATYALGVFNDNFFKQAAMLLAVAAGLGSLQGKATILFSAQFIIFSAAAGWLADRFVKRNVIIGTKILELAAMIIGAYGILTTNWNCMLAMVGLMGFQSTLFSPSLNGSIPELYPEWYVSKANAVVKLVTTLAILAGIALAGICLDQKWMSTDISFGRILVAAVVLIIAVFGVLISFKVNKFNTKTKKNPFPRFGPIDSFKDVINSYKDKELFLALLGSCFFYGISSLIVLILNTYGVKQLKYSQTLTSLLPVSLMVGVCIGSFLGAKLTAQKEWYRLIFISIIGIGVGSGISSTVPVLSISHQKIILFCALILTGTFGGMLLIPIASFIQLRPSEHEKGKILGANNFLDFSGILLAGQTYIFMDKFKASYNLVFLALVCAVSAIVFYLIIRRVKNAK